MKAMLLHATAPLTQNPSPLSLADLPEPKVEEGEVLIRVSACGVCHTELDEIEGRMSPRLPIVLGHQVVGTIRSSDFSRSTTNPLQVGQRVGVAWIASACGHCEYCLAGNENLCADFKATGRDQDGGYAEYMTARADFVHPIPASLSDSEAAPLLCAGAIGYRSLRLTNLHDGQSLGLTGFGGSNHLVLKMAKYKYPKMKVFVFSRNSAEREFALSLGADWAGAIDQSPPEILDAVIETTPVWGPALEALKHIKPGGRVVINGIRKEEADKEALAKLDYPSQLWMEKEIKSVANVTRQDVRDFLSLAAEAGLKPEVQEFDLKDANAALLEMKQGKIRGSKVLRVA
ncbi:MAG TPA: zinc-dependent alcohol dehydrogenase family protein [Anaerolineales bacterium]|nr:zinc-dependent alcohol dehydrogenase family protein [Anaerolineales bacterium]